MLHCIFVSFIYILYRGTWYTTVYQYYNYTCNLYIHVNYVRKRIESRAAAKKNMEMLMLKLLLVPYFGLACDHGNSFLCLEE